MSTWMVVEDEPDLYDTLLALFEIWSIDGVAFTNGTDAIKWIEETATPKDRRTLKHIQLMRAKGQVPWIKGVPRP